MALITSAFKAATPPTQKLVLLALCDSANDQGECYPSVPTLTDKTSLSERAIQGAVSWLEQFGYLRREFRHGRSTVYWCTPAAGAPQQQVHPTPAAGAPRRTCTPQDVHPAGAAPTPAADAPPPPQDVHPTPAAGAPITVIEPSVEPLPKQKQRNVCDLEGFATFWAAYPRKTARPAAVKAYAKLRPSEALLAQLLAAIARQCNWPQWQDDGGRYVPHPATWINGRRWEDEAPAGSGRRHETPRQAAAIDRVIEMTGGLLNARRSAPPEYINAERTEFPALG